MALLIKALGDLKDFLPYLVLVGGWVPLLYSRFLWKEGGDPLLTVDIDLGIRPLAYHGKETIAQRVLQKRWGEHHMRIGHDTPFVPVVSLGKNIKADVDFIASAQFSSKMQNDLVGQGIYINRVPYFEVLLEKTIPLSFVSLTVHVPHPTYFVFHKLLTYNQREDSIKRGKDLYSAYFILLTSPHRDSISQEMNGLLMNHPQGVLVQENISRSFEDPQAEGPTLIAQIAKTTEIATLLRDVKEDSFARIKALIPPPSPAI
jgi:hypothetical protein